jgi:hypothetical protein
MTEEEHYEFLMNEDAEQDDQDKNEFAYLSKMETEEGEVLSGKYDEEEELEGEGEEYDEKEDFEDFEEEDFEEEVKEEEAKEELEYDDTVIESEEVKGYERELKEAHEAAKDDESWRDIEDPLDIDNKFGRERKSLDLEKEELIQIEKEYEEENQDETNKDVNLEENLDDDDLFNYLDEGEEYIPMAEEVNDDDLADADAQKEEKTKEYKNSQEDLDELSKWGLTSEDVDDDMEDSVDKKEEENLDVDYGKIDYEDYEDNDDAVDFLSAESE